MVWLSMIAFLPDTVFWVASHFSKKAMNYYIKVMEYTKRASPLVLILVLTSLVLDAVVTEAGNVRNKDVWMFALIYTEITVILAWIVPHF